MIPLYRWDDARVVERPQGEIQADLDEMAEMHQAERDALAQANDQLVPMQEQRLAEIEKALATIATAIMEGRRLPCRPAQGGSNSYGGRVPLSRPI